VLASSVLALALTAVAAWTDARRHLIYNWTTYPGVVAGLLVNGMVDGWLGVTDALAGFAVCGGLMVACFVFFGPELGGGDVKLIAMMAACLGLNDGILAMLWTFVVGFFGGLAYLIWSEGTVKLWLRGRAFINEAIVMRGKVTQVPGDDSPLKRWLFLGPAACLACGIVRWNVLIEPFR